MKDPDIYRLEAYQWLVSFGRDSEKQDRHAFGKVRTDYGYSAWCVWEIVFHDFD